MIATGSDPILPPIPGLPELDGVWTNREVTGLAEVPERLLVLGGGPVGVEMAQALARMCSSVALVEGMDHLLPREPKPLGDALGEALAAEGVELCFGQHASAVRRQDGEFVLEFPERDELRGDRLLVATAGAPASTTSVSRTWASSRAGAASKSTRACAPATASGRPGTPAASGRSHTSGSTRARPRAHAMAASAFRVKSRALTTGRDSGAGWSWLE
ncbi:MAG TPA: FAD-dependent oxidoreductase [Thermoleophilaceae bacterium]